MFLKRIVMHSVAFVPSAWQLSMSRTTLHVENDNNQKNSKEVETAIHEATTRYTITCPPTDPDVLQKEVSKHVETLDRFLTLRPIAAHTQQAFEVFLESIYSPTSPALTIHDATSSSNNHSNNKTCLVLDSGCGTGKSTLHLAQQVYCNEQLQQHQRVVVLGIDRSLARLGRNQKWETEHDPEKEVDANDGEPASGEVAQKVWESPSSSSSCRHVEAWLLRADLVDFWRLLYTHQIPVQAHYLLYPNPYPKSTRWKNRFHGHAVFPLVWLLQSESVTLRSNWRPYLEEWQMAVDTIARLVPTDTTSNPLRTLCIQQAQAYVSRGPRVLSPSEPAWTNFEQKYKDVGETTYELVMTRIE